MACTSTHSLCGGLFLFLGMQCHRCSLHRLSDRIRSACIGCTELQIAMNAQPQTPFTSLYESQQKIHPREVTGRFANLRNTAVIALLGLFYGLPWLRWDGRQAVLFDLPA